MKKCLILFGMVLLSPIPGLAIHIFGVTSSSTAPTLTPTPILGTGPATPTTLNSIVKIAVFFKPGLTSEQKSRILERIGYYQMLGWPNFDVNSYEVWVVSQAPVDDILKKLKANRDVRNAVRIMNLGGGAALITNTSKRPAPPSSTNLIEATNPTQDGGKLITGKDYLADEVLVIINKNLSEDEQDLLMQKMIYGIGLVERMRHFQGGNNIYCIKIINGMSVREVIKKFEADPNVYKIEPNSLVPFE